MSPSSRRPPTDPRPQAHRSSRTSAWFVLVAVLLLGVASLAVAGVVIEAVESETDQESDRFDASVDRSTVVEPAHSTFEPVARERVDTGTNGNASIEFAVESETVVATDGPASRTAVEVTLENVTDRPIVHADGTLSDAELATVFSDLGAAFDGITRGSESSSAAAAAADLGYEPEEVIRLEGAADLTESDGVELEFESVDPGTYAITLVDNETGASGVADVTVEPAGGASFESSVYPTPVGDPVEFTLALEDGTDEAWIQVGGPADDFVDVLYVADGDDTGEVSFWFNPRTAGTAWPQTYDGGSDTVVSLVADGDDAFPDEKRPSFANGSDGSEDLTFEEYLDALGVIDATEDDRYDQLERPLGDGSYDLRVSATGSFVATDQGVELERELDDATIALVGAEPGDLTVSQAPPGAADEASLDRVRAEATETDAVAMGDRLLVELDAPGVHGALAAAAAERSGSELADRETGYAGRDLYTLVAGDEWLGEGLEFAIETESGSPLVDLNTTDRENVSVYSDPDDGLLSVVVDTRTNAIVGTPDDETPDDETDDDETDDDETERDGAEGDDAFLADTVHNVTVRVGSVTDDDASFRFGDPSSHPRGGAGGETDRPASPMRPVGDPLERTASFTLEPAAMTLHSPSDDVVQLNPTPDAVVSGTTNVAPGTDATLRVDGPGANDTTTVDLTVDRAGNVRSDPIDFSDRSESESATVTVLVGETEIASSDAQFVRHDGDPFSPAVEGTAPQSVDAGTDASLIATFRNQGDFNGTAAWSIAVENETVASGVKEVAGRATATESASLETDEPGTLEWTVEYGPVSDSGTVVVEPTAESAGATDEADDDGSGNFGLAIAIAILLLLCVSLLALLETTKF